MHDEHQAGVETHQGRVTGITDNRLVIKSGNLTEQSFSMVHDVRVTRNGRQCSVYDLRLGVAVLVSARNDDAHEAIAIEWIDRVG